MLAKNLNADLTNPNVYNPYEDPLKVEHVYDEIKQKEGYNNPGKYFVARFFITNILDCICNFINFNTQKRQFVAKHTYIYTICMCFHSQSLLQEPIS